MFSLFRKTEPSTARSAAAERVFLHIGVHKTGSTHLQGVFKLNRPSLTKAGVFYLPLKQCREAFTLPCVNKKLGSAERGAAFFNEALRECHTALISDENLIGIVDTLLAGHFYPRLKRNIQRIRAMVGPHRELNIYCCVRNYGDWLESAYLQTLKRRTTSFEVFLKKINLEHLSWVRLVQELEEAACDASITLWTYESYCRDAKAIQNSWATDLKTSFPRDLDSRPNPSLSEMAVKILAAAGKEIRKEDRSKLYRFLRTTFSTNQNYPKPRLLPPDLRVKLDTAYRSDLSSLQAIPNLRILGSAATP